MKHINVKDTHVVHLRKGKIKGLGFWERILLKITGFLDGRRGLPREDENGYWTSPHLDKEVHSYDEFSTRMFGQLQIDKKDDYDDQIITYARHYRGKTLLVVANRNINRPVACKIMIPSLKSGQKLDNLLPSYGKESTFQVMDNELRVNIAPARVHVFEIDTPFIENYTRKVYKQH